MILGTRRFEGEIQGLSFIPESDQLLVVQFLFGSGLNGGQVIPRIWDFTKEVNQKQIVRLQEKQVTSVELSEKGEWAAFSNGTSISVYALSNLADEQVKIRPFYERNIQTMAFHPDGKSLAVAYDGGYLVFWDLEEVNRFVLPPVLSQVELDVTKIGLRTPGLSMRICTKSNLLGEYLLDPGTNPSDNTG
ncbi:MAG: WD40 repeat domain-containing protein [Saprospiraceae bacterium]